MEVMNEDIIELPLLGNREVLLTCKVFSASDDPNVQTQVPQEPVRIVLAINI